jgi:hypothetical protein
LVGKPEGKRPLGRPGHRWEDNIAMDLKEVGWNGVDWTCLAVGQMLGCCEHDNEVSGFRKCEECHN